MRKTIWIGVLCSLSFFGSLSAQQAEDKKYLLSTYTLQGGISTLELNDGYLSDLMYSGVGLKCNASVRRFLNTRNNRLSLRSDYDYLIGVTANQPQTASIIYMGMNAGYGAQYHYKPFRNAQVLVGGEWDTEMGIKSSSREVNNANNIDLATNLNLALTLMYDFPTGHSHIRMQADFRSPLLGCMFVPVRGESYTEIFDLMNFEDVIHFTSLHNKNGVNARYLIQIPLKKTILNISMQSERLKYRANNMFFKRNVTSLQIGVTCDLAFFGGWKNNAPSNFLSSEW